MNTSPSNYNNILTYIDISILKIEFFEKNIYNKNVDRLLNNENLSEEDKFIILDLMILKDRYNILNNVTLFRLRLEYYRLHQDKELNEILDLKNKIKNYIQLIIYDDKERFTIEEYIKCFRKWKRPLERKDKVNLENLLLMGKHAKSYTKKNFNNIMKFIQKKNDNILENYDIVNNIIINYNMSMKDIDKYDFYFKHCHNKLNYNNCI